MGRILDATRDEVNLLFLSSCRKNAYRTQILIDLYTSGCHNIPFCFRFRHHIKKLLHHFLRTHKAADVRCILYYVYDTRCSGAFILLPDSHSEVLLREKKIVLLMQNGHFRSVSAPPYVCIWPKKNPTRSHTHTHCCAGARLHIRVLAFKKKKTLQ